MQLIIIVLAAFGLGYGFARSDAPQRLTHAARNIRGRLRRKPGAAQAEATQGHGSSGPEAGTA
jgi:hypothetical protein